MPPNGILPGAKFTLRPSLAFYIGSVTERHLSCGHQANFAAWDKEIRQDSHHVVLPCHIIGRPFVKWFALCYQTVVCPVLSCHVMSCLSLCDVGALWPSGWTDQDETWHAGRPRPWPHCLRWRPSPPFPKGHSLLQFSAHICCGLMAVWSMLIVAKRLDG